jgi:Ca-activated chloride channel homolog
VSSQLFANSAWLIVLVVCCITVALAFSRNLRSKAHTLTAPYQRREIDRPVSLVALPVVVTDWHGRFVSGLRRDDFLVFEDGKPQDIAAFREENHPMTIGLVVDGSESMRWRRRELVQLAMSLLESSNPLDEIFLVMFNGHTSLCSLPSVPSRNNLRQLQEAILTMPAEGETALYDAILLAMQQLALAKREQKSLVIISDGDDNASRVDLQEVLTAVATNSVQIYSLAIVAMGQTGSNPTFLKKLAKTTGGKTHILNCISKFPGMGWKLARELHEHYTLLYASSIEQQTPVFRTVRVKVRCSQHKLVFVRTRTGYAVRARHPSIR